jgi:L,D-peptidoglycan transpeptidase YkuD (ErfK/YbiS/YcfS/YnhG family)
VKKSAGGIGTALFFIFLIFVAARNDDGDWFTPNSEKAEFVVPGPDKIWNTTAFIGDAEQILVVATSTWDSTNAEAALFEKTDEGWKRVLDGMPARVGRSGLKQSRSEGDGSTPAGSFRIGTALGAKTKLDTKLRYSQITEGSCWISESGADYNRWTTKSTCIPPNVDLYAGRTGAFERAFVIDFNAARTPDEGSALFVYQQTAASSSATSGSVALSSSNMVKVLDRLDADKRPRIIIGTVEWLSGTASASSNGSSSGWEAVSEGSSGERVRQVQYALTAAGYPTKVDGVFAKETDTNVRKFQTDRKLKVDGVVGTQTAQALGLVSNS